MEQSFLKPILILFSFSAFVIYLLGRLKISPVSGFLVSGIILGPSGLGVIESIRDVEMLSQIGILLLMFTLGLEFSIKELFKLKREVLFGGSLQVFLTIFTFLAIGMFLFHNSSKIAFFQGILFSLSSTAIVFKYLLEKGEIHAPHGRISVGILLFQDLCVIPFMLFIPFLSGEQKTLSTLSFTLLKAFLVVFIILFSSRWVVPYVLKEVAKTRYRELFILSLIIICAGTAFFTSRFGLSLSLGAFLAGVVISESEYASQAISDILPLKEIFLSIFFVSVGMLLDLHFLLENLGNVIFFLIVIIFLKSFLAILSSFIIGYPLRPSIQAGLSLFQIGEFSFVLLLAGISAGIVREEFYNLFIGTSVLTMILTPLFLSFSLPFSIWLTKRIRVGRRGRIRLEKGEAVRKKDHVIIVGFGVNGRNLSKVLKETGIPYAILEMNPETVRAMKKLGEPIYYGDGTSIEVLKRMGLLQARILVVAISDAASTRQIVRIARKENHKLYIIVRTRYLGEVEELLKIGADEVVPEEFETSIEIFSRVLSRYHIPINVIHELIGAIRKNSYSVLRTHDFSKKTFDSRFDLLKTIEIDSYLVKKGSALEGHSIKDLKIRTKTGVTVVAIQREDEIFENPKPDFILKASDLIWFIGKKEEIRSLIDYLDSGRFLVEMY